MIVYKKQSQLVRQAEFISRFDDSADSLEALYGLSTDVKFCAKCVISNQRPNSTVWFEHRRSSQKSTIAFSEAGVCDACGIAEAKRSQIDWQTREAQFRDLCDQHRGDKIQPPSSHSASLRV
jgi:hypothetical protein